MPIREAKWQVPTSGSSANVSLCVLVSAAGISPGPSALG